MSATNTPLQSLRNMLGRRRQRNQNPPQELEVPPGLIYAIGDVHGRHDLLAQLLETIRMDMVQFETLSRKDSSTHIVFLGDYIDRGHNSRQVLETLCNLDYQKTQFVFLKGNHEEAMLKFLDPDNSDTSWLGYGGRETLASYGVGCDSDAPSEIELINLKLSLAESLPANHLEFLLALKSYWIAGKHMFVHAGIDPKKPPEAQSDRQYLWIRDEFLSSIRKLPYIIVHGHTPEDEPTWDGRRIGIDTGAYISNKLTAARLFEGKVEFLST